MSDATDNAGKAAPIGSAVEAREWLSAELIAHDAALPQAALDGIAEDLACLLEDGAGDTDSSSSDRDQEMAHSFIDKYDLSIGYMTLAAFFAEVRRETIEAERCRRIDAYATLRVETVEACARHLIDSVGNMANGAAQPRDVVAFVCSLADELRALQKGGADGR